MKRSFVACLAGALLVALPALAHGQISASAHNFSGAAWNTSNEICIVCHAPHNNVVTLANAPLWNHDTTAASFTVYASPTLDATVGQPAGISKLCLSCHDGTVALDSYGGTAGTNFITNANGDSLGVDLGNDHPISFAYTAALDPSGLNDPTTTSSGLGSTIDVDMLFATELECASCHDVHNGAGIANLLRKSNATSALCLTCHNK